MARQPFMMSPNYLAVAQGIRALHRLTLEGKDESPEADAARDAIDAPWEALTEAERERVRVLSEALYSISDAPEATSSWAREDEAMSTPNEAGTFTIELPENVLTSFARTPESFAREVRLAAAIEWYREGRVSQGKGAEIAGLSRREFIEALSRAEVDVFQIDAEELREEVERDLQVRRERLAADLPDTQSR
jgi:predicted HTH domain antitoxin